MTTVEPDKTTGPRSWTLSSGNRTASADRKIRTAEAALHARYDLTIQETFVTLSGAATRLRVLSTGGGRDVVLLHGVSLSAAVWFGWLGELSGFRVHIVELPGHGLSGPVHYRKSTVREHSLTLLDELLDALNLDCPTVIGHSLAGMFALWHAAARPGRIRRLVIMGTPAGALPGMRMRMPLSLLTMPGVGVGMLASPSPRGLYRRILDKGLGGHAAQAMPAELVDALRSSARRPGNRRTVASLMRAIDGFHRARDECALSDEELSSIDTPTLFCWGSDDPFLSPQQARRSTAKIPGSRFEQFTGGHVPWLDDPAGCADVIRRWLPIGSDARAHPGKVVRLHSSAHPVGNHRI